MEEERKDLNVGEPAEQAGLDAKLNKSEWNGQNELSADKTRDAANNTNAGSIHGNHGFNGPNGPAGPNFNGPNGPGGTAGAGYAPGFNGPNGPGFNGPNGPAGPHRGQPMPKKKKTGLKAFLIIAAIFAVLVFLVTVFVPADGDSNVEYVPVSSDHIAVLNIVGTISMDSGEYTDSAYNQTWLLNTIDGLIQNPANQGLVLYLNTPGGSVYAADEVFLKLQEYKETGRPIYAYFGPTAASAGYYIAMNAEQIYANRNSITGSIGVTLGTYFDVSELLNNLGIKTYTPVTGTNKDMGSGVAPITDQQKVILQSIIDESYDRFLDAICASRDIDRETLIPIADGRIYTAQQALDLKLIDQIGSLDEAIDAMVYENDIYDAEIISYSYTPEISFWDLLLGAVKDLQTSSQADDQLKTAMKLMEQNKLEPMYMMVP